MAKDGVVQAGSVVGGRGAAPDPARGKPPETPAPFPFRSWLPERSSPSRVRCAAPDRRALDRSGPFQALHLEKGKGANAKGSLPASRWSASPLRSTDHLYELFFCLTGRAFSWKPRP